MIMQERGPALVAAPVTWRDVAHKASRLAVDIELIRRRVTCMACHAWPDADLVVRL